MNRFDLLIELNDVHSTLERLVYDEGIFYDTALYGLLLTAMSCVDNASLHLNEYIEND